MKIYLLILTVFFTTLSFTQTSPYDIKCTKGPDEGSYVVADGEDASWCKMKVSTPYIQCMCDKEKAIIKLKEQQKEREAQNNRDREKYVEINNIKNRIRDFQQEKDFESANKSANEGLLIAKTLEDEKSKNEEVSSFNKIKEETTSLQNNKVLKSKNNNQSSSKTTVPQATSNDKTERQAVSNEKAEQQNRLEQQNLKRQQEENRKKREYEQKKKAIKEKRKYDDRVREQNNRTTENVAMGGVATAGALIKIGLMIYGNMGNVSSANTYFSNQFYSGIDMGYSLTSFPMVFNSNFSTLKTSSSGKNNTVTSKTNKKVRTNPINLNFNGFVGFESDYIGVETGFNIQPGMSIIFNAFNFNLNGRLELYGGAKKLKGVYNYERGARRFFKNGILNAEQNGSGVSAYIYQKHSFGVRLSLVNEGYSYSRHHITLGIIRERILDGITRSDGTFSVRVTGIPFPTNPTTQSVNAYFKAIQDPIVKGLYVKWTKEHFFSLFANFYGNYPLTGLSKPGYSSGSSASSSTFFMEIGFLRQIKSFSKQ
jgi:hypothetical protein